MKVYWRYFQDAESGFTENPDATFEEVMRGEMEIDPGQDTPGLGTSASFRALNALWKQHNQDDRPDGWRIRSMSVGDLIGLSAYIPVLPGEHADDRRWHFFLVAREGFLHYRDARVRRLPRQNSLTHAKDHLYRLEKRPSDAPALAWPG